MIFQYPEKNSGARLFFFSLVAIETSLVYMMVDSKSKLSHLYDTFIFNLVKT